MKGVYFMKIEDIQLGVIYQLNGNGYYLKDKTKVKVFHKRTVIVEKTGEEVLTGWCEVFRAEGFGADIVDCEDLSL